MMANYYDPRECNATSRHPTSAGSAERSQIRQTLNPVGVTPETVDINIPKQLVEIAGFDHLGFGEVTVEVEYCALPVDVVNNCNSTSPLDIHH